MTKGWGETSGCATLWGCSMVHRGKNIVNGSKKSPISPCNVRAVPALCVLCPRCAQTPSMCSSNPGFLLTLIASVAAFPDAASWSAAATGSGARAEIRSDPSAGICESGSRQLRTDTVLFVSPLSAPECIYNANNFPPSPPPLPALKSAAEHLLWTLPLAKAQRDSAVCCFDCYWCARSDPLKWGCRMVKISLREVYVGRTFCLVLFPQLLEPWNLLLVVCEEQVLVWGWASYHSNADQCPATLCPSLQPVFLMHLRRYGCLGLNDALLCCFCLFMVRANHALVSTTAGVASVIFRALIVVLAKGGRGGGRSSSAGGAGGTGTLLSFLINPALVISC